MKTTRKISIIISFQMGFVMGAVFTVISMLKTGTIVPIGVLISALVSALISSVWGGIISVKDISEGISRKLQVNPAKQKFLYNLIEALAGDICFTPILCTFFITKNVGIHNPMFVKIWLSSLVLDFLICIPLNIIFCPLFKKVAAKIFKISSIN